MKSEMWMRTFVAIGSSLFLATGAIASLEVQQQGAVSFISGGVGEDETQEIKSLSSGYPLELMFVTRSTPNRYLSDVKVQIKDSKGNLVLDTESRGPFLLAKVPPGRYSISTESGGTVKHQTVQVTGGKTQRVTFVWNQPVDQLAFDQ